MSSSGQLVRNRSVSSATRSKGGSRTHVQEYPAPRPQTPLMRYFEPCAATASMFLYAQGASVVCCHHDTLTIERRFSRHQEEIQLLAVDTQSETGAGRLVVSYDASQTAIVWDIMSGDEVARFASFEHLTTAAWMRNGNVAFGNTQGNIILFEPQTSEHISSRTIDQIAVTALAPAADCRTFAIGYQNGSLLIANLQPRFTILHNLTTSRGPSPVLTLAWHASSTRQKSDMLSSQTNDGDLRVWSVAKSYNNADPAKVVRILKKSENYLTGPNWMGWSKNGRIIQFCENETLSWDVRTKHVTYDSIPTLEHVRGLAVYGPGATLFTLGANNTVQQFDLNAPAMIVANVQHPANLLPPSPPVSIEEQEKAAAASNSESEISIQIETLVSESDDDHLSPLARMIQSRVDGSRPAGKMGSVDAGLASDTASSSNSNAPGLYRTGSPQSSRSGVSDISTTSSRTPGRGYQSSLLSRGGMTDNTYISAGSSIRSSAAPYSSSAGRSVAVREREQRERERELEQLERERRERGQDAFSVGGTSMASISSASMASANSRAARYRVGSSRLRNEVPRSPEDARVHDLFKFTRSRLSDVPYKMPPMADASRLTNDDLRRQMLLTVFGWSRDVEDLIRDEMSRHASGSPNRILLAKWLGDLQPDILATSSENMTSSDWMLLALSGIGTQASQHKLGRAYVQRLLENGDVHAAATIMIGMGDHNDAIEIYLSHRRHMEALLLTGLFFPSVWGRQAQILKKWGEWAVQHNRQQLAIRCFACIGKESSEPWASPSAAQLSFASMSNVVASSIPEVLSPPLSPPGINRGPQRSIAKTSALKLITSFGDSGVKAKYFAGDDGQTPIAAGVTPIAESAVSPGGFDPATAFLRPSQRSTFNTPSSARPGGGFGRHRLPSIGEAPGHSQSAAQSLAASSLSSNSTVSSSVRRVELPTPPVEVVEDYNKLHGHGHHRNQHSQTSLNSLQSQQSSSFQRFQQQQQKNHPTFDPSDANASAAAAIGRASTASPMMMRESHRRREPPPPSPSPATVAMLMDSGRSSRNGPRNRIPDGVDLQLLPLEPPEGLTSDITSPEQSVTSSTRFHWPTRRRGPASVTSSSVTSASSLAARSNRGRYAAGQASQQQFAHGKTLDDYIHSLDAAHGRARTSSRDGRGRVRESSQPRKGAKSREGSADRDRGRGASRGYTPRAGKRSPRSPVPMSPEDLINLSTPRMLPDAALRAGAAEDAPEPSTVRKASSSQIRLSSSKTRAGSRTSSRGRRQSPERAAARGRSGGRDGSATRSPSSPVPMPISLAHQQAAQTGQPQRFSGSEDENDYRMALESQERFRRKTTRSTSRGVRDGSPAGMASGPASGANSRRPSGPSAKNSPSFPPGSVHAQVQAQAAAVEDHLASLRRIKDERQLKKEAAARELEERRKSLARRPAAPPIPHPDELSPVKSRAPAAIFELPSTTFTRAHSSSRTDRDVPPRSQTVEPGATRSMYATRTPAIGLPATPKAMRLILEPEANGGSVPGVPQIPLTFAQRASPSSATSSPRKSPRRADSESDSQKEQVVPRQHQYQRRPSQPQIPPLTLQPQPAAQQQPRQAQEDSLLTLLPSTVYSPPVRPPIPRCMSAPPEEPHGPRSGNGSSRQNMTRMPAVRKLSTPDAAGSQQLGQGVMRNIDGLLDEVSRGSGRRPSRDDQIPPPPPPPPPPPAPPVLKELQHLAQPPPPPPAPLPFAQSGLGGPTMTAHGNHGGKPVVYGGQTSGMIEIVMDNDDQVPPPPPPPPRMQADVPVAVPMAETTVPIIAPPAPPSASHHRGRSSVDNSIASRISRATERMRSVSRSRTSSAMMSRKSPEMPGVVSPYESVPMPGPPVSYQPRSSNNGGGEHRSPVISPSSQQPPQHDFRTGLHHSEMI